jgi:prolyl-tRNA synthetase
MQLLSDLSQILISIRILFYYHSFIITEAGLVVDPSILLAEKLGFRCDDTSSYVMTGKEFKKYVDQATHLLVDFSNLVPQASKVVPGSKSKAAKPGETTTEDKNMVGLTVKKDEDFSLWYSQVLLKSEMMDYYDISGVSAFPNPKCYIIRPWAFKIWKSIQQFFGGAIEDLGVEVVAI